MHTTGRALEGSRGGRIDPRSGMAPVKARLEGAGWRSSRYRPADGLKKPIAWRRVVWLDAHLAQHHIHMIMKTYENFFFGTHESPIWGVWTSQADDFLVPEK